MLDRTPRLRWWRLLATGVVACAEAPAAAVAPPACVVAALSPSYARDRTLVCVVAEGTSARILRSADAGRSWTTGARLATEGFVGSIALAPAYPADPSIYVTAATGVWATHDDGRTVAKIADYGLGDTMVTPFASGVTSAAGTFGPRHEVAIVNGSVVGAFVYDPAQRVTRTVLGGPMQNFHFVMPRDYPATRKAVVLAHDIGARAQGQTLNQEGLYAYECVGDLTCTRRLALLGTSIIGVDTGTLGDGSHYVVGVDDGQLRMFRSGDGGRSWARWTSVEQAARKAYAGAAVRPLVRISGSADAKRRLWLSLALDSLSERGTSAPAHQLWRSDDGGATWRRSGHAWGSTQHARGRSSLPWNDLDAKRSGAGPFTEAAPGGVLVAVGAHRRGSRVVSQGISCSRDLGRTWSRHC